MKQAKKALIFTVACTALLLPLIEMSLRILEG